MIKDLNPYLVKDRGLKKTEGGKHKKNNNAFVSKIYH